MKKINRRDFLKVTGVSALAIGLSSCSNASGNATSTASSLPTSNSGASTTAEEYLVGFANNSDTYNYCAKFRSLLADECKNLGITLIVTDAGGDTNVQNGQIDDFITQKAKIVSAISNDLDGSVPALEAAKTADIPYISFLTSVSNGDDYPKYIYIGSQNYDAGKVQGEYLVDKMPENAQILYFTGVPNDQQYLDRKAGMEDALKGRTDIKVLAEYNVENAKDLGMSTAEDCLQSYEKFDAIVCQNDDSALGVVEALKGANRLEGVTVIGIDGSDDALASVKNGEMKMTVLQDAAAQAKAGANVFEQIREGTDPATIDDIYVPFQMVTVDNVNEYLK